MAIDSLPPQAIQQVASYFAALAEPTRLAILNLLRREERSVGDIATALGCSLANASRHLSVLTRHGLVERHARGVSAYYRIADPAIDPLCDLVCDAIARRIERGAPDRAAFLAARNTEAGAAEAGAERPAQGKAQRTRRPATAVRAARAPRCSR
ncbi:MAG: ArsR/SmtB family transcription factor [Casimicrobiaceae bacterium]